MTSRRGPVIASLAGLLCIAVIAVFLARSWSVLRARWLIRQLGSESEGTFAAGYRKLTQLPEDLLPEVIDALGDTRACCRFPVPVGDGDSIDPPMVGSAFRSANPPAAPRTVVLTRIFFRAMIRNLAVREPQQFPTEVPFPPGSLPLPMPTGIVYRGSGKIAMTLDGTGLEVERYHIAVGVSAFLPDSALALHPASARDLRRRRAEVTASWEAFYSAVKPYMFFEPEKPPGGSR